MPSTTYSEFGHDTEAIDVATAFGDQIRGRTALITGVNLKGIGFTTAQALASQSPANLILTGRNLDRIQDCINALKSEFPAVNYRPLVANLSSQASVRAAADTALAWPDVPHIGLIINSAGVMGVQERTLSEDGIEMHLATNHIGHWLLSCLLMPKLIAAAQGKPRGAMRIVNVAALVKTNTVGMRWSDINFDKTNRTLPSEEQPPYHALKMWNFNDGEEHVAYNPLDAYLRSKAANALFGIALTRKMFAKHGIMGLSVHPGIIQTELSRTWPAPQLEAIKAMAGRAFRWKTQGAGASTSLVAALDPKLAHDVGETRDGRENFGAFLIDCQIQGDTDPRCASGEQADRLWALSEELTGQTLAW